MHSQSLHQKRAEEALVPQRPVRDLDGALRATACQCAGRDGRMGSAGAEQKDGKKTQKEDAMTSDAVA